MGRSNRGRRRRLVIAATVAGLITACGGNDSTADPADATSDDSSASSAPTQADGEQESTADPVAVEACLEDAGLRVRNQDEVDQPYTAEELDFFELETEILVEGGDTEYITGGINFYRTIERAEAQEVNFEESVTDYTVGRTGTAVYTFVGGTAGGELDTFIDTVDRCLTDG
jgi:hypothetical protein